MPFSGIFSNGSTKAVGNMEVGSSLINKDNLFLKSKSWSDSYSITFFLVSEIYYFLGYSCSWHFFQFLPCDGVDIHQVL